MIAEERIGQVVSCNIRMSCWFPYMKGNWRQQRAYSGGGAFMDLGIHCIDLAEYLLGSEIDTVSAFCDTKTFSYDIDDSANVMLKNKNGTVIYINNHFNVPDDAVSSRIEIFGTKGSLIADGTIGQTETGVLNCIFSNQEEYSAIQERATSLTEQLMPENGNLYTKELQSFSDSVIRGAEVEVPFTAAVRAQEIIEAAYRSSSSGRICKLEEE